MILFLGQGKASSYGSLYLDEHGEEDLNLNRGRPLYLDCERFERLDRALAGQGPLMDTKILQRTGRALV